MDRLGGRGRADGLRRSEHSRRAALRQRPHRVGPAQGSIVMSGALLNLGGPKFSGFLSGRIFNASGGAGPRRLMILTIAALAVLALVVVVAMTGRNAPANSRDAHMKHVDPLPGGLNS